ncbi:unnamed protein product [Prorocentrum cordatum]|uniref:Uncharacterized protein n=1 Tax=Prorocentrum cordatum TaxID=2364126 RepID=A0ABN9PM61_9DINO|nr:unnamed protein product [Polarella glacialis]
MHQDWIQDVGEGRKHSAHGRIDILFRCQLQDKQRRQVAGVRLVRDAAPSILEPWGCILLPPLRTHLVQRGPSSSCPGRSPPLRVLRRVLHQVLVLLYGHARTPRHGLSLCIAAPRRARGGRAPRLPAVDHAPHPGEGSAGAARGQGRGGPRARRGGHAPHRP